MSSKRYSDSLCKEKLWGQIGEQLKKIWYVPMFFIAHIEVTIVLLSPKF